MLKIHGSPNGFSFTVLLSSVVKGLLSLGTREQQFFTLLLSIFSALSDFSKLQSQCWDIPHLLLSLRQMSQTYYLYSSCYYFEIIIVVVYKEKKIFPQNGKR